MATLGGDPPGTTYGSSSVPSEMMWNPAKYAAEFGATSAAAAAGTSAAAAPLSAHMTAYAPWLGVVAVIWILARYHASLSASGRASA